jgi:hypothetical protein
MRMRRQFTDAKTQENQQALGDSHLSDVSRHTHNNRHTSISVGLKSIDTTWLSVLMASCARHQTGKEVEVIK